MPKRSRTASSGSYPTAITRTRFNASKTRKAATTNKSRSWPYNTPKTYLPYFDPVPGKINVRLRYSEVISINPGVGVAGSHFFNAMSLFDPNTTGVGHQPYGFDFWALAYNHYRVNKAIITVRPAYSQWDGIFGVALTDDTTAEIDFDTVRERKGVNYAVNSKNGSALKAVTNEYNIDYWAGKTHQTESSTGGNPGDAMYFQVFCSAYNSTTDLSSTAFVVDIVYDATMYEVRDLGQS